jgi:hypothetical protein
MRMDFEIRAVAILSPFWSGHNLRHYRNLATIIADVVQTRQCHCLVRTSLRVVAAACARRQPTPVVDSVPWKECSHGLSTKQRNPSGRQAFRWRGQVTLGVCHAEKPATCNHDYRHSYVRPQHTQPAIQSISRHQVITHQTSLPYPDQFMRNVTCSCKAADTGAVLGRHTHAEMTAQYTIHLRRISSDDLHGS